MNIMISNMFMQRKWMSWCLKTVEEALYYCSAQMFCSFFKGGRFCHSATSRVRPLESCTHAAIYSTWRSPGGVFCSLLPIMAGGRWGTTVILQHVLWSTFRFYSCLDVPQTIPVYVSAENATAWILPFTSGGFLYIALVNVVPDLLEETSPR